ncbi:hypothetical protein D3C87_1600640 [compost metagenome]
MERKERYLKLRFARDLRYGLWVQSRRCGVPFKLLVEVERHSTPEYYATVVMLLETKTFKSAFRERAAGMARDWFENAGTRAARLMPLSLKHALACQAPGMESRLRKMPRQQATEAHLRRLDFGTCETP